MTTARGGDSEGCGPSSPGSPEGPAGVPASVPHCLEPLFALLTSLGPESLLSALKEWVWSICTEIVVWDASHSCGLHPIQLFLPTFMDENIQPTDFSGPFDNKNKDFINHI